MELRVLPTSFSSLSSFETCPLRYYLTKSGQVDDPPGEAALWGSRVHEALEFYLRDGTPLPVGCKQYQPYADLIKNKYPDGELLVELELAVDANFQPCAWDAEDAWFRGIIDVGILVGDTAYLFDWKTGRQKDSFDQLELFSAMATSYYPHINTIHCAYVWLKEKTVTARSFSRDDARKFWAKLAPRVARLESAYDNEVWPARPSGLCRNWCPVGKRLCVHCGK